MSIMNEHIRNVCKTHKIKLYQVGDRLGVLPSNFSTMLRYELPPNKERQIMAIIEELISEGTAHDC